MRYITILLALFTAASFGLLVNNTVAYVLQISGLAVMLELSAHSVRGFDYGEDVLSSWEMQLDSMYTSLPIIALAFSLNMLLLLTLTLGEKIARRRSISLMGMSLCVATNTATAVYILSIFPRFADLTS